MKLREYISEDKPREKLKMYGVQNLSDSELLCILLRTGNKNESVNELVNRILKSYGGLKYLADASLNSLMSIDGIKLSKASVILSSFELGKRVGKSESVKGLNDTYKIFKYFKDDFMNERQEKFFVLCFDSHMSLISKSEIFRGTVDRVQVFPRDVFREAIRQNASYIILMHNHPSGDVRPSKDDIDITNSLIKLSEMMGIKILDHIIISSEKYYSFYVDGKKDLIV